MKSIKLKKAVMVAMASILIFGGIAKVGFANEINSNIVESEAINQQEKFERLSFKEYMNEMKVSFKDIDEADLTSLEELYNEANEKWEAFDKILKKYYIDYSEINNYETVGEIIDFRKDEVHVLTGDIAQSFKVDEEKMKDFYLGQTVGVKKIGENKYELVEYKDKDFSVRYTSMGQLISTVTGKVKEVNDNEFIISTKDGDMEFEAYDKLPLQKGTEVTVEYIDFEAESGEKVFLDIYNESSKINLTIKNIKRTESGTMMLSAEDEKGLKYEVYTSCNSVFNFHHSDLKENDKITVYPEVIRESYPAQVDAKMIKKM